MDNITSNGLLKNIVELADLRNWMAGKNLKTHFDLCLGGILRTRLKWKIDNPPPHLICVVQSFLNNLKVNVPGNLYPFDHWGWGTRNYNIKRGYHHLLQSQPHLQRSSIWKYIWHSNKLPKINIFCWAMVHGKLFIGDTLINRGIQGPTGCVLCLSRSKTIQHIFLECAYATTVWKEPLQNFFQNGYAI